MEIEGKKILGVPRDAVWRALNDPAVLQRCLAGCDTFEQDGENRYRVALQATVGPVRARFSGKLELQDIVAPTSYALSFEGSGGVAGFGKGSARVTLQDVPGGTSLHYVAQAQVGGRLAQVGGRLIDGVTRRMADDFFTRFSKELAGPAPAEADAASVKSGFTATSQQPAAPALGGHGPLPQPAAQAPQAVGSSAQVAVLAAAIAATAAAVASLAVVLTLVLVR